MKVEVEEALRMFVGTKGLEDLTHISELLPSDNTYCDPTMLASYLLTKGIDDFKCRLLEKIEEDSKDREGEGNK